MSLIFITVQSHTRSEKQYKEHSDEGAIRLINNSDHFLINTGYIHEPCMNPVWILYKSCMNPPHRLRRWLDLVLKRWTDLWSYSQCCSSAQLKDKVCPLVLISDIKKSILTAFVLYNFHCSNVKIFQIKCSRFQWSPVLIMCSSALSWVRSSPLSPCVCAPSPTSPERRASSPFPCRRKTMDSWFSSQSKARTRYTYWTRNTPFGACRMNQTSGIRSARPGTPIRDSLSSGSTGSRAHGKDSAPEAL